MAAAHEHHSADEIHHDHSAETLEHERKVEEEQELERKIDGGKGLPYQKQVSDFYLSDRIQVFVAFLIGANFLTNIAEKQLDPYGTKYETTWLVFDYGYNICFTLELGVNLYAHWFVYFWKDHWNIFDTIVVSIGLINMAEVPLPSAFSLLRMMRAFRIFRLFNRVPSLKKNIQAIMRGIPGVMNAFVILTIVMCIYAILGVEVFQDVGDDCQRTSVHGDLIAEKVGYETIRKFCLGEEYFGTFSRSLYSFFQVLTGESWSEMIARPVIWFYSDSPIRCIGAAMFFISFVLVSSFILTNVVVAVLLDHMSAPDDEEEEEKEEEVVEVVPLTDRETDVYRQSLVLHDALEKLSDSQSNTEADFSRLRADMYAMHEDLAALAMRVKQDYQEPPPNSTTVVTM